MLRPPLHENRHRYYDPFTGTYMQVDPKVEDTWEAYNYVEQNPVMKVDPTGEDLWDDIQDWLTSGPLTNQDQGHEDPNYDYFDCCQKVGIKGFYYLCCDFVTCEPPNALECALDGQGLLIGVLGKPLLWLSDWLGDGGEGGCTGPACWYGLPNPGKPWGGRPGYCNEVPEPPRGEPLGGWGGETSISEAWNPPIEGRKERDPNCYGDSENPETFDRGML